MAYKLYGRQVFEAEVNGKKYTFTCYGQSTSYGFRHICTKGFNNTEVCAYIKRDIISKVSYYNRTWERFTYETVLKRAIENLDETQEIKDKLYAILIDKTAQDDKEECERQLGAFKSLYDGLTDENKEHLKNGLGDNLIQTEEQAKAITGIMKLMTIMQG